MHHCPNENAGRIALVLETISNTEPTWATLSPQDLRIKDASGFGGGGAFKVFVTPDSLSKANPSPVPAAVCLHSCGESNGREDINRDAAALYMAHNLGPKRLAEVYLAINFFAIESLHAHTRTHTCCTF